MSPQLYPTTPSPSSKLDPFTPAPALLHATPLMPSMAIPVPVFVTINRLPEDVLLSEKGSVKPVSTPGANFAAVTDPSTSLAVLTETSASFAEVTDRSAILAVVMAFELTVGFG